MGRKIFNISLILMIILSISTAITNVNANTQIDAINTNSTQFNKPENKSDNNEINEAKTEENIKNNSIIRGKVQYSITEAPGPIIQKPEEETVNKRIIDPSKPMVAITYDDGPSEYTADILNTLKENNSAATFFVLGSKVYTNKDILNKMLEDGNQIGNHTYNHKKLTTIDDEELHKQIKGTDDLIYIATGYTPSVMRPPYGVTNDELNKKIAKPIIKWSIDTRDWENRNTEKIVNSILEDVKDGDIVLMHDLYDSTAKASKIVIPELIKRGYQLVTVDELFEYRNVISASGVQYNNAYNKN